MNAINYWMSNSNFIDSHYYHCDWITLKNNLKKASKILYMIMYIYYCKYTHVGILKQQEIYIETQFQMLHHTLKMG